MDESLFTRELAVYNDKLRQAEERIASLEAALQHSRREAIHDRETALLSSAYFLTRLQEEIVRSERYRHFLSLILIHLQLKNVQSTQELNRELAQIGREMSLGLTRRSDTIALYRRCQMIILLPETDGPGAAHLLERYHATFPSNDRTLSYSVLTYPVDASNLELVLTRLQDLSEGLYRGTSAVRLSRDPLPSPSPQF
ncbi:MAG TPA: diguanylate cyclase [Candidatus Sumerlaeota bacterium]|nr:MAG: hypothetical protein BWZ08_01876 [candidate division BRC1 bacterium ADurb.BinA292]HOE95325.1 diguanylate cyclase [Candidatus Sumerlaeota bacterium]HOR28486.1 diguanylate cyclase [Candidatus Sumerlaeota bacterium]HPK02488.1 diguanylate cyclase [Candidatus Sumerlaeota bacterium]